MALEDHGAVEAGACDALPVDDDSALARLVEACQDVEHRGLAAAGGADHPAELAAVHRQPEILEHRDGAAIRAGISLGDAFDRDEFFGHRYSGNVTMRVKRARIWSSSMPTMPIVRIAMMTLVIERLFHSFQTK